MLQRASMRPQACFSQLRQVIDAPWAPRGLLNRLCSSCIGLTRADALRLQASKAGAKRAPSVQAAAATQVAEAPAAAPVSGDKVRSIRWQHNADVALHAEPWDEHWLVQQAVNSREHGRGARGGSQMKFTTHARTSLPPPPLPHRRSRCASRPPPPATCTSAARAPRCSTGCMPERSAASSCCGERPPPRLASFRLLGGDMQRGRPRGSSGVKHQGENGAGA
jgi:hypothetical protein